MRLLKEIFILTNRSEQGATKIMVKPPLILFIIIILTIVTLNAAAEKQHRTGLIFNDAVYNQIPLQATLTRGLYDHLPAQASLKKYSPLRTARCT